jgi:hypothetical protein
VQTGDTNGIVIVSQLQSFSVILILSADDVPGATETASPE